jgi:predicted secreted acid phosphatase
MIRLLLTLMFTTALAEEGLKKYAHDRYFPEIQWRVDHLIEKLDQMPGEPWLLFLDIDETMISHLGWIEKDMSFKPNLNAWDAYVNEVRGEKIDPVYQLFQYAKSRDYPVVIATGRFEDQKPVTIDLLSHNGYQGWDAIYFNQESVPVSIFKTRIRCQYSDQGYSVINVGDQLSDMIGGCSKISLKLPNPFYSTGSLFENQ